MALIPSSVTKSVFRSILILKKSSPNLMFVGGVAGAVTSTVLACRATLRLADELPVMKKDLEAIREGVLTEEEEKRALALAYSLHAARVVRIYAPSVVVGAVSIGALTGSHVQLTRRNAGLMAAYAAVDKAYDEYRSRVQEELGTDKELDIYRAITTEKVELSDGKKTQIKIVNPDGRSAYSQLFAEHNKFWQKEPDYNRMFIQMQQTYAQNRLMAHGHVFLNEVYDMLGIERTPAGSQVGWIKNGDGDGFIDFGLHEAVNSRFMNGWEQNVWLDFNVDGVIWDKI